MSKRIDLKYRPKMNPLPLPMGGESSTETSKLESSPAESNSDSTVSTSTTIDETPRAEQNVDRIDRIAAQLPVQPVSTAPLSDSELDAWATQARAAAPSIDTQVLTVESMGRFELAGGAILEVGPESGHLKLTSRQETGDVSKLTKGRTSAVTCKTGNYYVTVIYVNPSEVVTASEAAVTSPVHTTTLETSETVSPVVSARDENEEKGVNT